MPLDQETIERLLAPKSRGSNLVKPPEQSKGVKSLGPLRTKDISGKCVSHGCGVQTHIMIDDKYMCIVHALNELNYLILKFTTDLDFDLCDCNAGKYSKYNRHSESCGLIDSISN